MALRKEITLKQIVNAVHSSETPTTLLGVCPMSQEIIRATIELAKEHGFPAMFVASRNQISEHGGYVMGLTPQTFVQMVEKIEDPLGLYEDNSPPYLRHIGVDHCGPWYRTEEKNLGMEEAIESVEPSLTACVEAGYSLIHIDPSFPPPTRVEMDRNKMISLGIDLVKFTEDERIRLSTSVEYEIGTEETTGPGTNPDEFRKSVQHFLDKIGKLPKPVFIVGKTGAKIGMLENIGTWDYTAASSLPKVAREFDMGFKEHNADYLSDQVLALHPLYGITAANVGPSFAAAQTKALLDLANIEYKHLHSKGSNLYAIMSQEVLKDGHFEKWLNKGDSWTAEQLEQMPSELRAVTMVCGHYVYDKENVKKAIEEMYANLKKSGFCENPQAIVMKAVKSAIMRYVNSFNLAGSTARIAAKYEK